MPRAPREAPIYPATHDLLDWLVPHLEHWPRPQRFLLAREVMDSATQFYRLLLRARKVQGLARADALLEGFRPGVMERLGVGPDEASRNPALVAVDDRHGGTVSVDVDVVTQQAQTNDGYNGK